MAYGPSGREEEYRCVLGVTCELLVLALPAPTLEALVCDTVRASRTAVIVGPRPHQQAAPTDQHQSMTGSDQVPVPVQQE